jgi:hypothetical protein
MVYYILQGGVENQEKSALEDNLPPGRNRGPIPALPAARPGGPPSLFDKSGRTVTKPLSKPSLMINEIVTRLDRNFWYYGGKIFADWI